MKLKEVLTEFKINAIICYYDDTWSLKLTTELMDKDCVIAVKQFKRWHLKSIYVLVKKSKYYLLQFMPVFAKVSPPNYMVRRHSYKNLKYLSNAIVKDKATFRKFKEHLVLEAI